MVAQSWPIEEMDLAELEIDLRNVRILGAEPNEMAIANYLVEAEDLLVLMRDILRDGYLDNELPVVTRENGKYVVLEGNRRVTALKAIAYPSLVGKSKPQVERLKSRYPNEEAVTAIRVMIAPSREDAQQLLARLHTRNPKKSWVREQQAIFYHAQLSPTMTVDDLRTVYPSEAGLITRFIKMGEMRELIRTIKYADSGLEEFVKASKLKMSSLEYAYNRRRIQQVLGLEFSKDGLLVSKNLEEGQLRGLMHLLSRFKDDTLNTRSAELKASGPKHDEFIAELSRVVAGQTVTARDQSPEPSSPAERTDNTPDTQDPNGAGTENLGGDRSASGARKNPPPNGGVPGEVKPGQAGPENSGGGTRGPNRGNTLSRLNFDGFEYKGSSGGLRRRFEELKRIDVRDFPNAAHDLLRTVLECSIKDYFVVHGPPLDPKKTIGPCVDALARTYGGNAKITASINAINRKGKMSTEQYAGTTDSLNSSNHEPDHFALGPDVHDAWDRIKPILVEIVGQ